jgi:alcohol dehydrogenase, propanol-preferring
VASPVPVRERPISIVGTRQDLYESLQFAAEGEVAANYSESTLPEIDTAFEEMKRGGIEGRG